MIRIHNTMFCEKVIQTAQNSYVIVNPCPGFTQFTGMLGTGLKFDLLVYVGSDKAGNAPIDMQVLTTDGSQSMLFEDIPFRTDAPDSFFQIGINEIVTLVNEPGYVIINIREKGGEWIEAGRLSVRVPVTTHSVQVSSNPDLTPILLS